MNNNIENKPSIPTPETRSRLAQNLQLTSSQIKECVDSMDIIIARLDAQINAQPMPKGINKQIRIS